MEIERTTCACAGCVALCKRQPGSLAPGDFERIAAALGEDRETATRHFWASPGAVVMNTETMRVYRIGTITPRLEHGRCVFLTAEDRCAIHAVAPAGCRYFDIHMDAAEGHRRGTWVVRQQQDATYQALRATLVQATSYRPRSY